MAARLALRRISFLNFASSSTSSTLRPLASTAFPFSSDATRDATAEAAADAPQPAPGLSPANVATLDDVTVSASIIETGDVLLSRPRVANLPEDLSPEVLEEVNRIPSPPEKVKPVIPFPTLAKVQRNTRQEPQLLADAIRLVKVLPSSCHYFWHFRSFIA
jgi:hypothetical protein